jgi:hypothetical protein
MATDYIDEASLFHLPAVCTACEHVFVPEPGSPSIRLGIGGKIFMRNGAPAGKCPKCDSDARFPGGDYVGIDGGSIVTTYCEANREAIERVIQFAKRIVAGESPADVAAEAQSASSDYFQLWREMPKDPKSAVPFCALVIAFLTFILTLLNSRGCSPAQSPQRPDSTGITIPQEVLDALLRDRVDTQHKTPSSVRRAERQARQRRGRSGRQ